MGRSGMALLHLKDEVTACQNILISLLVAFTEAGGGCGQELVLDVVPADVVAGVGVTVTDDTECSTECSSQVLLTAVKGDHVRLCGASDVISPDKNIQF